MIDFKQVLAQKGKIDEIVDQISGEIIEFPKGTTITAIDPVIVALPKQLFDGNAKFESIIEGDDDMEVGFQPNSNLVFIVLRSGRSLLIKRSSQSIFYTPEKAVKTNNEYEADYEYDTKLPHRVIQAKMENEIKKTLRVRVRWKNID